jgi:hypothetical protein
MTDFPADKKEKLIKYLRKTGKKFHSCVTQNICAVKKLMRADGTRFNKYYCDHHLHVSDNSIRKSVIAYRDCRVDSANTMEAERARISSHELCCASGDYCNFGLEPIPFVRDLEEHTNANSKNMMGPTDPTDYVETLEQYNTNISSTLAYDDTPSPISSTIFSPTNIVLVGFFFLL